MDILYTPWRGNYAKSRRESNGNETADQCPFCKKFAENNDRENFILRRFKHNVLILNLFPYNAGHLMVIPTEHVTSLDKLTQEARIELMEIVAAASTTVEQELGAQGVNVGINLGKAAGAGIPAHLHVHVLPRWTGDTNFMPLLANTKTVSFDLNVVYEDLKPVFDTIKL